MFEYIPDFFRPSLEQHSDISNVYRLVINIDHLTCEDFIPSIFEDDYNPRGDKTDYSVSLNKKRAVLLTLREKFTPLKKYNGLAIGNTSITRGVSIQGKTHVNYYLFDYINNSPCDDFEVCEVFK